LRSVLTRIWEMLFGRVHGPFAFRLILQPLTATFFAARAALSDARAGRPPYGWALLTNPRGNRELQRECLKDVGKVFVVAVVMDLTYEIVVFRWIYPGQAVFVAAILAMLPYPLIRGLLNRKIQLWRGYRDGPNSTKPAVDGGAPDPVAKGRR
jgi:hypothetical protein